MSRFTASAWPCSTSASICAWLISAVTVHWEHGLFAANNGIEVPLLYASTALAFALVGPGSYSLDAWFGIATIWTAPVTAIVLALGIVGALGNLALRHRATSLTGT